MNVSLWSADFLFSLRKIFWNKMFQAWSKQLENEGMGTRIGVSSFSSVNIHVQSTLQSQNTFFYVYILFVFLYYSLSLFRKLILFIFWVVYCDNFTKALFLFKYIQSFLKLVHEFELLKLTFWLDVRRNFLLYYLQV